MRRSSAARAVQGIGVSWRWAFYINVPVAAVVLVMAARAIPAVRSAGRPIVDYAGIALVALGASRLILGLSWGGNEYAWGSPVILGLFAASAALLTAFVLVELRVPEPMLPMGFSAPCSADRITQLERAIGDTIRKTGQDPALLDQSLNNVATRLVDEHPSVRA